MKDSENPDPLREHCLLCSRFEERLRFRKLNLSEWSPKIGGADADPRSHLSGYRDSAPVRIGNGAAFHLQFDIYGELLDGIYLYNKYGKPVTWEQWVAVREILGAFAEKSL